MSERESPFDARLNEVRKAFSEERSVYDVISAHQALEALAAVIEAANHLNERAKVDLAEWYEDDGEYEEPNFLYFITLDAALTSLGTAE